MPVYSAAMSPDSTDTARRLVGECKAVLFDFDGVIIDSEWPIYETWKKVFEDEGHELPIETYVQCIGSDFATWSPEKHLESLTGKTYLWDAINARRRVELESDLVGIEALPGVRKLLVSIKSENRKLAVVSSSSHGWVDSWLENLDLMSLIDITVCRGDAPRIKPAPDLYLEAVRRFGVNPGECLVIEDSLNGIKAGKAAGCRTLAVPSRLTSCLDFSIADTEIECLGNL